MNILMSICLIIVIFFGHSFILSYEIARSKNKGKKYVMLCFLINLILKIFVHLIIINFLVTKVESFNNNNNYIYQ